MAKKKALKRSPRKKARPRRKAEQPADPLPPENAHAAPTQEGPAVKITVDRCERGKALFATCGRQIAISEHRNLLLFDGPPLFWTKKKWSENRSEIAVFTSTADLLLELERAKRAAPFQAPATGVIVEWKTFLT